MTAKSDSSWRNINLRLPSLTEAEVSALLDAEVAGQKRIVIIDRLLQRLSKLRSYSLKKEVYKKLGVPQ